MKELRKIDLFGESTVIGYKTDDGVMNITPHYKDGSIDYIRIETPGSGNHAIIATERLDEVLRMLLTLRKLVLSGSSVGKDVSIL